MEKESTRAWALLSSIFDYGYIDSNIKAALAHITYRKRVAIHLLHAIGIICWLFSALVSTLVARVATNVATLYFLPV